MNYHNITYPDMNNGDGLRVVLWLSGCSHHCYNCQNPQTWDANSGIPFDKSAKEELFRELDKDYISGLTLTGGDPLHESNLDGVLDIVTEFNKRYRIIQNIEQNKENSHNILNENADEIRLSSPQKTIWLYTGYKFEDLMKYEYGADYIDNFNVDALRQSIISQCHVLVDGKYIDSQRDISLRWRGSSNQRVIDIKKSLRNGEMVLYSD